MGLQKMQVGGLGLRRSGNKARPVKRGRKVAGEPLRESEVELLRSLYESGMWTVETLAIKFEISVSRTRSIVTYKAGA